MRMQCINASPWAWWRGCHVTEHVANGVREREELSRREKLFWAVAIINSPHAEWSPSPSLSNQTCTLPLCLPHDVFLSDFLSHFLKVSTFIFPLLLSKGWGPNKGYSATALINDHPFNWATWHDIILPYTTFPHTLENFSPSKPWHQYTHTYIHTYSYIHISISIHSLAILLIPATLGIMSFITGQTCREKQPFTITLTVNLESPIILNCLSLGGRKGVGGSWSTQRRSTQAQGTTCKLHTRLKIGD